MFSASLANYPHRDEEQQLPNYPHQLFIPPKPEASNMEEELEDLPPTVLPNGYVRLT